MPNYTWMYWNNQIGLDMNDMGNGWWQNHLQFRTNSGFNGDQTNRLTGSNGKSCRENHMRRKVKWQGLPLKKCHGVVQFLLCWFLSESPWWFRPRGYRGKPWARFRSATAPPSTLQVYYHQKWWFIKPYILVLWCFGHIFNWLSNITGWTLDDIGIHHL